MKNYSNEIVQAIKEHLEEREMKMVAFDESDGSFGFCMHLHGPISFIHYIIKVHEDDYTVVALCPVGAASDDPSALLAMSEFVARANYGLKNGNFEMDFDDGELRYKCFVDCDEQIPSQNVVQDSISVPAMMMKRYAPGIIKVLYKDVDAKTAVEECEQKDDLLRELEEARALLQELLQAHADSDEDCESSNGFLSYDEYSLLEEEPEEEEVNDIHDEENAQSVDSFDEV